MSQQKTMVFRHLRILDGTNHDAGNQGADQAS